MSDFPEPPPVAEANQTDPQPPRRRFGRIALMVSLPIALMVGGFIYWQGLQGKISTDNAYVKQDMVAVSSEVGGRIIAVMAKEGDTVEAGQLLFRIDPEPYQLQIQQANAAIAGAQANVTSLQNNTDLTGVDISAAREDIAFAESRFERQRQLWERGFTTKADYDAAQHAVTQARESLRQAEARQREARAKLANGSAVPGVNPQIAAGEAQRASAQLNLRRTEVHAPAAGRVAEADRLQVGQQVLPNLPVLTLVEEQTTYVEANFKETDLADMAVGQRAELRFDAFPGVVLKGHVASIGAGTGSEFSVLPAQNASGNWVKVTQRVPVRIAVDDKSPRPLIAGLSTEVTVFTATGSAHEAR
ncbi:HlyD family secretion protein [Aurantiacibacter xanthus]|nr:HlyD family secretion protein [Aurantiacibacter xanthus]